MKTVAKQELGHESPSRVSHLQEKLGKQLQLFFAVDRTNRWPVQGWSSSDEAHRDLDEDLVAEEVARPFAVDKATRWPLQGWCKAHKPYKADRLEAGVSTKPGSCVPSRWPQGW